MLNLGRKPGESITLLDKDGKVIAQIFVNEVSGKEVSVGIEADRKEVRIWRGPPPVCCSDSLASLECQQTPAE